MHILRYILWGIVGFLIALLLGACDNATTGTVTSRQHEPAYTEYWTQCLAIGNNPCAVPVIQSTFHPECWEVNFHNDADDENGHACIDEREYYTYQLGDRYPHLR